MSKSGPKPKLLNPETRRKLCDAIRSGSTHELACKYAGIGVRTFYDAMAQARSGDPEWSEVLEEIEAAEGAGAVQLVAIIRKSAMDGTWPAAAWILERRYPMMYGRSESRFVDKEQTTQPYQTREELVSALRAIPADVLAEALSKVTDG